MFQLLAGIAVAVLGYFFLSTIFVMVVGCSLLILPEAAGLLTFVILREFDLDPAAYISLGILVWLLLSAWRYSLIKD